MGKLFFLYTFAHSAFFCGKKMTNNLRLAYYSSNFSLKF